RQIDGEGREVFLVDMGLGRRRIDVLKRDRAVEAHGAGIVAQPFRPQARLRLGGERDRQGRQQQEPATEHQLVKGSMRRRMPSRRKKSWCTTAPTWTTTTPISSQASWWCSVRNISKVSVSRGTRSGSCR